MSAVPTGTSAWTLPPAFDAMRPYPQWFVYRLYDKDPTTGKFDKAPIAPHTRSMPAPGAGGLNMCTDWATAQQACVALQATAKPGESYVLGFWLTDADPFFFLDIDQCLVDGAWSPLALELLASVGSAARAVSSSGRALHVIGSGRAPAHKCKNTALHLELYTSDRGIAIAGHGASGDAATDCTALLPSIISKYFAADNESSAVVNMEWTMEPRPEWSGPEDDDELIEKAKRSRSSGAAFGSKASFADLYDAKWDKLADMFPSQGNGEIDNSSADMALANHLAFWTGGNCERIERLMRSSGLARDKWEREDYLRRTILTACATVTKVYNDRKKTVPPGTPVPPANAAASGVGLDDFYAYLPEHKYIFVPTREVWPASGVDASVRPWPVGMKPSVWLDGARPTHQMTWVPGQPMVICNRVAADGGWIDRNGANTFNLYRPPAIAPGDPNLAGPWLELVRYDYPNDADHIIKWHAHRRQRPGEKINHALVFGGSPGIGKDTIIEPLKHAVGPWNFTEVAPKDLLGDFNPHVKSVVLRVSEARDSGDMSRYALYEHCKTLLAAPPDVLRCNEKNLREHAVFNVVGVIFTTNHRDGLYLPANDRRHYVAWSEREQADFRPAYWNEIYRWYHAGGFNHVVAYLDSVDLSGFDPKATPTKTAAFLAMVDAGRAPEEGDMADTLERLASPSVVTLGQLQDAAAAFSGDFAAWLRDRRNRKQIGYRLAALGYDPIRNPDDKHDGQWRVGGKRQTVYARKELAEREKLAAASALRR